MTDVLTRVRTSAYINFEGVLVISWSGKTTRLLMCISDEASSSYSIARNGNFSPNIVEFKISEGWPQPVLDLIQEQE